MPKQSAAVCTVAVVAAVEPVVSIEEARVLVGPPGKPLARQTVMAEALRGELEIRRIGSRLVVSTQSIHAYRARHGLSR